MSHRRFATALVLSLVAGCGGSQEEPVAPPAPSSAAPLPPPPPPPVTASAPPAAPEPPPPPPPPPAPTPVVRFTGFATPESVIWDEARDRYLVSNINGKPVGVDNNGFISELSPDGKVTNLKWIEGGKHKVTLNAPKGLAIVKDTLYVADLDTVRLFDVKTGKGKGEIKLKGATFANDVAVSEDGSKIYVSDSGLKMEGADFKPTGTDAVWVIEKNKAKEFAKSTDLNRPNGLLVDGKTVIVVPFGSNEIYRLDEKGKKTDATKLPHGGFDGIVKVGDSLLVSSWEGSAIYKGKLGGSFEEVFGQLKAPADIGFDKKRNRVLVPRFMEDAVEAYEVKLGTTPGAAPSAPLTPGPSPRSGRGEESCSGACTLRGRSWMRFPSPRPGRGGRGEGRALAGPAEAVAGRSSTPYAIAKPRGAVDSAPDGRVAGRAGGADGRRSRAGGRLQG